MKNSDGKIKNVQLVGGATISALVPDPTIRVPEKLTREQFAAAAFGMWSFNDCMSDGELFHELFDKSSADEYTSLFEQSENSVSYLLALMLAMNPQHFFILVDHIIDLYCPDLATLELGDEQST